MQKGFLSALCRGIFTAPDDATFLEEMAARFPRVGKGFAKFAALPAEQRLAAAREELKNLPRSGWSRIGIPADKIESVDTHAQNCVFLSLMFSDSDNFKTLAEMMDVHDLAEAVIGDFTPFDSITPQEKHRLEEMALRLVFESSPEGAHAIALWREFEARETENGRLGNDIDHLDLARQAMTYAHAFPHLQTQLQEFVDYAEEKLLTTPAKIFFYSMKKSFIQDFTGRKLDTPALRP